MTVLVYISLLYSCYVPSSNTQICIPFNRYNTQICIPFNRYIPSNTFVYPLNTSQALKKSQQGQRVTRKITLSMTTMTRRTRMATTRRRGMMMMILLKERERTLMCGEMQVRR